MSGTVHTTRRGFPQDLEPNGTLDLAAELFPLVVVDDLWRVVDAGAYRVFEDFALASGGTLPAPWGTQDTSTAGAPTLDYSDDAAGGQFVLKLAADNEVEAITLFHSDQLTFDPAKVLTFHARVKIEPDVTGGGGELASGDTIAIGFATARDATLDDVTEHAWFRLVGDGANKDILFEADDGTTDTDDQDSGQDWTADTWIDLQIVVDADQLAHFYVDGVKVGEADVSQASGNWQPIVEVAKAAAANNDHRVTIDLIDPIQHQR